MTKQQMAPVALAAATEAFDQFLRRTKHDPQKAAELSVEAGWTFARVWASTVPRPKPKKDETEGDGDK